LTRKKKKESLQRQQQDAVVYGVIAVVLIFVDTAGTIGDELDKTDFCEGYVFWGDRAAASILCFYVLCYFVQKSRLMVMDGYRYFASSLYGTYHEYNFIDRNFYVSGRLINLLSLNLTCAATLLSLYLLSFLFLSFSLNYIFIVLFTVSGVINLIVFTFTLFFLNDLPKVLIDTTSQRYLIRFMEQRITDFEREGVNGVRENIQAWGARRKVFWGLIIFFGVPVLLCSVGTVLFLATGVVLLPICKLEADD